MSGVMQERRLLKRWKKRVFEVMFEQMIFECYRR